MWGSFRQVMAAAGHTGVYYYNFFNIYFFFRPMVDIKKYNISA